MARNEMTTDLGVDQGCGFRLGVARHLTVGFNAMLAQILARTVDGDNLGVGVAAQSPYVVEMIGHRGAAGHAALVLDVHVEGVELDQRGIERNPDRARQLSCANTPPY